jgi:predicted alpha/beta superfamily hydrolase
MQKKRAESELTISLTTPEESPLPVYIAGNFNHWGVGDEQFRMERKGDGRYEYTFRDASALPLRLEYKFQRGSWEDEELDAAGNKTANRHVMRDAGRVEVVVPRWRQRVQQFNPDYLPLIRVIDEAFEIPQLIKTRRIAALLPHDYEKSEQRYPVLYLQDGQNLFDDYAPFGNWAVDKRLAQMAEKGMGGIIIISIDHAEHERVAEFTPSIKTRLGAGDGKKYARFLADTLKPFIDKTFRTLPDRAHTGIGGSSMGGLISIYAGLMYPEVYSRLMIFSPSLWVAPDIHTGGESFAEAYHTRIYLYGGEDEGANVVPDIRRFKQELERQDFSANVVFQLSIDPKGRHNEERWGREFPKAVSWLFFE